MKPFKMFFGMAIGIILLFFVARVIVFAFILAAVMSIGYTVYRRLKDFINYDRFGEKYFPEYHSNSRLNSGWRKPVEPLFYSKTPESSTRNNHIRYIKTN